MNDTVPPDRGTPDRGTPDRGIPDRGTPDRGTPDRSGRAGSPPADGRTPKGASGGPPPSTDDSSIPLAVTGTRRPFNVIWIIPIVALAIAGFLGYRALMDRGPSITVTFRSADGLTAGQTRIKHKAVDLGTVRSIDLSKDMTHVDVRIDMRREASRVLTDQARFWVVRPRLSTANVSGLDTLVSGSYIELDPGAPNGKSKSEFTGLEDPPAIRSDEPGDTFNLKADRIGSIGSGSPVFYRDINAGEVLGYDLGPNGDGVTIHAFIHAPFNHFVRENSHFWNVSGLSVEFGGAGLQVHVASLQALISGAVAFDIPKDSKPAAESKPDTDFQLFPDENTANSASSHNKIGFVSYVDGSVRGLATGAPVQLYGIQIGTVSNVQLQFDPNGLTSRVAVKMLIEPDRIVRPDQPTTNQKPVDVARALVRRGLRVQLQTTSYLTGALAVAFVFQPDAPGGDSVGVDDGLIVLPSVPGGLDSITSGLSEVSAKLGRLPLDDIAKNLNATLAGVSAVANGPELKSALNSMSSAVANVQDLVKKVDAGLTPTLKRLPEIAQSLQGTVDRANKLVGSVDTGYGGNSDFRRNMERLLVQVSDTARSVRLLADYLDAHPEALIRGRTNRAGER